MTTPPQPRQAAEKSEGQAEKQHGTTDGWKAVSPRKLKANRENAKKSTGPKTPTGKAYSRRNALTHGLFSTGIVASLIRGEKLQEYHDLLKALHSYYQPIGASEKLEVDRIAMCWWRLGRAWRYENSVNQLRSDNVDPADLELFVQHRQALLKETEAITLELEKAQVEILDTGQIPQELKQKFLAWGPPADQIWQRSEQSAAEELDSLLASAEGTLTPRRRAAYLGLFTVRTAELCLKRWTDLSVAHFDETALADCLIPNRDALDKLIRYETSVERSLGRAVDRLERLQRRRKGEPMPPPVNVHLT